MIITKERISKALKNVASFKVATTEENSTPLVFKAEKIDGEKPYYKCFFRIFNTAESQQIVAGFVAMFQEGDAKEFSVALDRRRFVSVLDRLFAINERVMVKYNGTSITLSTEDGTMIPLEVQSEIPAPMNILAKSDAVITARVGRTSFLDALRVACVGANEASSSEELKVVSLVFDTKREKLSLCGLDGNSLAMGECTIASNTFNKENAAEAEYAEAVASRAKTYNEDCRSKFGLKEDELPENKLIFTVSQSLLKTISTAANPTASDKSKAFAVAVSPTQIFCNIEGVCISGVLSSAKSLFRYCEKTFDSTLLSRMTHVELDTAGLESSLQLVETLSTDPVGKATVNFSLNDTALKLSSYGSTVSCNVIKLSGNPEAVHGKLDVGRLLSGSKGIGRGNLVLSFMEDDRFPVILRNGTIEEIGGCSVAVMPVNSAPAEKSSKNEDTSSESEETSAESAAS